MAKLGRVLTAMVTPFDTHLRVNEEAAVRLMNRLVEQGSDGLVICGTTGEASTLSEDEQLRMIELAVGELRGRATVVAGAGSNDTRHAVSLTERATELGADGILSVTPYYNKPNRRGIVAHFNEVAKATDRPIVLYNIPARTGVDMPNDLLAELAQLEHVEAVKQANAANLALVDGLDVYAGNDDLFCDVLEMGAAGGILVASHLFGPEFRRMANEPEVRREIDASLQDAHEALSVAPYSATVKAALNMLGLDVGGPRLPLVELDEQEAATVRSMLERHNLLEVAAR
jgi:4-hydroxy-tetrahydrodipicolinate synthase